MHSERCCSQGMKKVSEEGNIGRKLSDHKLNRRSDAEWLHLKPLSEGTCSFMKSLQQVTTFSSFWSSEHSLPPIQTPTAQPSPATTATMTRSSPSSTHPTPPPTRRPSHPRTRISPPPRRTDAKPRSTVTDTRTDTVTLTGGTATRTRR